MSDVLHIADVIVLSTLVTAVRDESPVRRLMPDDNVVTGTVRRFTGDADGRTSVIGTDLRDAYLWVTVGLTDVGWPVRDVVTSVHAGECRFS